jgi:hypothetical protein
MTSLERLDKIFIFLKDGTKFSSIQALQRALCVLQMASMIKFSHLCEVWGKGKSVDVLSLDREKEHLSIERCELVPHFSLAHKLIMLY